jgi:hypothetical protein
MHEHARRGIRKGRNGERRRLGYANVVSTVALLLAIGGGTAWAAHRYLITSTSQIKPSVLNKLHGANGRNGTNGTNGANGTNGTNGANGAVAGLSAVFTGSATIPSGSNTGNFVTVVSKTLPAGDYIVNAKAETSATATNGTPTYPGVETECDLFSGSTSVDTSQATVALTPVHFISTFLQSGTTLPLGAALELSASTTVSIQCQLKLPLQADAPAGLAAAATNAVITAVQTSSNS